MKVKSLISKLQKLDPNKEVLLSSDSEGNRFALLTQIYDTEEKFNTETRELEDSDTLTSKNLLKKVIVLFP